MIVVQSMETNMWWRRLLQRVDIWAPLKKRAVAFADTERDKPLHDIGRLKGYRITGTPRARE